MFLSTPLSLNFLILLFLDCTNAKSTSEVAATTANLFNFAYPVVALPIASDKHDATTYLVACPASTKTTSCEFEQPFTLIQGPKTLHFAFVAPTASATQTFILDCKRHGTTSLGCAATGVSPNKSPSAAVRTTEALSYTGDAAKGFFRSVTLVEDEKALMTYTPGVLYGASVTMTATAMVGQGMFTSMMSAISVVSTSTSIAPSAAISSSATTTMSPTSMAAESTTTASAKESDVDVVVVDSVTVMPLPASSSVSGAQSQSGTSAPSTTTTSTMSNAWRHGGNNVLMAAALCIAVVAL